MHRHRIRCYSSRAEKSPAAAAFSPRTAGAAKYE
jgi:hypothetical protein